MISEREKMEFDSLPEFVRDPHPSPRDAYATAPKTAPAAAVKHVVQKAIAAAPKVASAVMRQEAKEDRVEMSEPVVAAAPKVDLPVVSNPVPVASPPASPASIALPHLPKAAELEALWPGVSHEFFHAQPKKGPSFYLTIGFMAGAVVSMIGLWGLSALGQFAATATAVGKQIVVAQGESGAKSGITSDGRGLGSLTSAQGEPATIVPLASVYEVATGDTLAGIALKNYKRATPRLLDEICKANNMKNANVLNLGQKIALPEYHPQARQIATGASSVQQ